jgi:phosphomannomutase
VNLEDLLARASAWRDADPDPATAAELSDLIARRDEAALAERFAAPLSFGTAGLRGILGAGPNRMNRAVVRRATAALARYLVSQSPRATIQGVVVGRDARRMSEAFADDAASVLAAHDLPALVFPEPIPTPLASYATLKLGAAAAVMITASHNPADYNGYKAYWSNGAQIIPPHDERIEAEMEAVEPASEVPLLVRSQARARGLWREIDSEIRRSYLDELLALRRHAGLGTDLSIVYTALHGVGGFLARQALAEAGFANVHPVPEQEQPDGSFPTAPFPNPEEPGALDLAFTLAERVGADLILANDPDADRLAVAVRGPERDMRLLSGNEIGVLLGHYLLIHPEPSAGRPLVMTTIVSSVQLGAIARALGARYEETLTGFKWIGNRALALEREEGVRFLFGYEEALGYSVGKVVPDKDGIGAALAFADLAGWCRSRGETVLDYLQRIQREFGLFLSTQKSFTFPGTEGAAIITRILESFRARPPMRVGELDVVALKDYQRGISRAGRDETRLSLPVSNVIAYELAGGSRVTLRPSGTEPKIKYYFELREDVRGESLEAASARGKDRLERLAEAFLTLARERGQPA